MSLSQTILVSWLSLCQTVIVSAMAIGSCYDTALGILTLSNDGQCAVQTAVTEGCLFVELCCYLWLSHFIGLCQCVSCKHNGMVCHCVRLCHWVRMYHYVSQWPICQAVSLFQSVSLCQSVTVSDCYCSKLCQAVSLSLCQTLWLGQVVSVCQAVTVSSCFNVPGCVLFRL